MSSLVSAGIVLASEKLVGGLFSPVHSSLVLMMHAELVKKAASVPPRSGTACSESTNG